MRTANPTMLTLAGVIGLVAGSLALLFLLTGSHPVTWDRVLPLIGLPNGSYFLLLARRSRQAPAES